MAQARAAVVGVGTTAYGRLPEYDAYDLGMWALTEALKDAGLGFADLDGIIVNRIPDYQRFCEIAGIDPSFVTITPGHGRFAAICIEMALQAVLSGRCRTVALVYGNNGRSAGAAYGGESDSYGSGGGAIWWPYGMTSPGAFHAMMMRSHMAQYGTKPEHLAELAMTFRDHAGLNPQAVMRKPFTLDDYMNARMIAEPLRLLDYCLINDGGVALIVTTAEHARDCARPPVHIRGAALQTVFANSMFPPEDYWHGAVASVTGRSFREAGLGRDDMQALMIYDNFTPTVMFSLEGAGYCGRGESGPFVAEGHLRLGRRYPTNTSGGHLSESYMQGWALNVEAVRQLRGDCGDRQVSDAANVHYIAAAPVCSSIVYSRDPS
ncbi:thiolase family protein [Prosthecomicrobium hirschii]|uniref:thiolase family protein n=1 Tax=Prosthecodimorpha hirschii TaxID=665126 RepID=UPI00221F4548|nr:thiolase family protein [Prosthecomicrobium hirschii]MCW1840107.1 thiolase family protein [Prosthecomicrobium hirschii]